MIYQIAISLIPNVGPVNAKKLIAYCGSVEAVFKEKKTSLLKIPGVGDTIARSIVSQNVLKRAEKEILFIDKYKIQTFFYLDANYPTRLKHWEDAPIILFYKGNARLNEKKVVSVVGTRNATDYGKKMCKKLIEGLVEHGALIVSGLAYGIDTCAHKGALENNLNTIAVLAHGLDRIYPSTNKLLAEKIVKHGGLLTEYLSETIPETGNFPSRNRIVAGLSDAVIVVESGKKGGALITADIANGYNRDVFAVPGRLGDVYSEGCNNFIKINKAVLVQSVADIEYIMGWELKTKKQKKQQKELFIELSHEEEKIITIIRTNDNPSIDYIAILAEFTMSKVATILLNLEFKGIIKSLPGKRYQLN